MTGRLCPITRQIQIDLVIHGSGRVYCTPPLPVAPTTIPGKRTVTSVAHQAETAVQVHNSTPEQPICWPSVTSMTQHTNTYHANNTTSEARHTRLSTRAHCYYEMTLLTDLFHMRTRLFSGKDKRASPFQCSRITTATQHATTKCRVPRSSEFTRQSQHLYPRTTGVQVFSKSASDFVPSANSPLAVPG